MSYQSPPDLSEALWEFADRQHGVVARRQLIELDCHPQAIKQRVATGRLHPVMRGVYAIGRPRVTRRGRWMAAVLACGPNAMLSHMSAATLWGIRPNDHGPTEVSVPDPVDRRRAGIVVHRRSGLSQDDGTIQDGIPVTSPSCTLIDIARRLDRGALEASINAADRLDLIDPELLRAAIEDRPGRTGTPTLRAILDRRTFTFTDSELERRFLQVADRAGLPRPQTGRYLNGFKVDFFWPQLGLVVETDGLRYHRTAAQQSRDRLRDQAHTAAGLTCLRFTHHQVKYESDHVVMTLRAVIGRLT